MGRHQGKRRTITGSDELSTRDDGDDNGGNVPQRRRSVGLLLHTIKVDDPGYIRLSCVMPLNV